jgi:hypothetical protein
VGVAVLDQAPDRARFEEQLERAARSVPRLRQRVVSPPLNVAPPEFVIDPNFDLRYHVRFVSAPGRGSFRELLDMSAPIAMQGFDRARPLWEFVVVEGLEDGRAALIQKMHHSLTDGVGAMKISMAFLDTSPDPPAPQPLPPRLRLSTAGRCPRSSTGLRTGTAGAPVVSRACLEPRQGWRHARWRPCGRSPTRRRRPPGCCDP